MEKPLISFIITYYNEPLDMLCECIDSIIVLPLTSDQREIIVVDDGSDESPVETLKQFGDAITYIPTPCRGYYCGAYSGFRVAMVGH